MKKNVIDSFRGEYRFLSNFYPSRIQIGSSFVDTVEHGYQGMKTKDLIFRYMIFNAFNASEAKQLGKRALLRDDWEEIKVPVMRSLVKKKFEIPKLRKMLLDTDDMELIEGNTWDDTFWGVCRGKGKNMLGKILMAERLEIRTIWE